MTARTGYTLQRLQDAQSMADELRRRLEGRDARRPGDPPRPPRPADRDELYRHLAYYHGRICRLYRRLLSDGPPTGIYDRDRPPAAGVLFPPDGPED